LAFSALPTLSTGSSKRSKRNPQLEPVVEQGREQIQPLEDVARRAQRRAEGGLLLISVALALWSVSGLSSTLADAFNSAYGLAEGRRWWKVRTLSLASGPLLALVVIFAIVLMLVGTQVSEDVARAFGLRELFVLLWGWLRYPLALTLLWAALTFVYRHSPAVTLPWRSVMPGAALAVLAWAMASVVFSVYLARFANFGVTYGSLGAAVGLLVYLNISASVVLAGAELNAAMHPAAAREREHPKPSRDAEPKS
jgi:membrane protein